MEWEYRLTTNTIWTSFDYGEVNADTEEEALEKAKEEITYNLKKCNLSLSHCNNTINMTVEMDLDQISIKIKQ